MDLPVGEYLMYIEISVDGETVTTKTIEFVIEDLNVVKEVEAVNMMESNLIKLIGRNYYDSENDVI